VIDLLLILGYLLASRFTRLAYMPAVAFLVTVLISFLPLEMVTQHILFILIYLCCALLSSTKIAYAMLASTVVNVLATAYFLSSFYIDNYSYYFAFSMTVVNLCILFTIIRSGKSGEHSSNNDLAFTRVSNLLNIQTYSKTSQRR
jgi:glycerol-3-phosphate acyltransferase PlsY